MWLLDGPMGTELQRRGYNTTLPLWSARALIECPDVVVDIHKEYILAGANVITTNSFRTNRRVVERAGITETPQQLTQIAVELARKAIDETGRKDVRVAGSDAPVEDCYQPGLVPSDEELRHEHREHIQWLAEAGCDIILIETMNTLREAAAACEAATTIELPFMVSVVTDPAGERILSGEPLALGAEMLAMCNPMAILCNCSAPRSVLRATEILAGVRMERRGEWLFGGYANSGEPDPVMGWEFVHTVPVDTFVGSAQAMYDMGARVIGSCCGTTPDYIAAIHANVFDGTV